MGNRGSSPVPSTSVEHSEAVDVHTAHYKELYADLTTSGSNGEPVDGKTFRVKLAELHHLSTINVLASSCVMFYIIFFCFTILLSQLGSGCKLLWWALS